MITERPDVVGIDAVPISSDHGVRGIGRYVSSLITAAGADESGWMAGHVRPLLLTGSGPLKGLGSPWMTRRPRFRPQDTAWLVGGLADRRAIRGDRPAIWHHTDPSMPYSLLPRPRTIATLYDLIPLLDPELRRGMRRHRRQLHGAYLRLVRSAGLVIAISEHTARQATDHLGVDPATVRVVYPAVTRRFEIQPMDRDNRLGLLFVGVPQAHKRPELAIAALAILRQGGVNAVLRFVGPVPRKTARALREVAGKVGVEDDVEFAGRLGDAALGALYSRSVLLAVSRHEGFGLPPVEAVLSGGRVVAVNNMIYREILGRAATFATGETPLAVAEGISLAVRSPTNAAAISDLERRFSPSATLSALRGAYMAILER